MSVNLHGRRRLTGSPAESETETSTELIYIRSMKRNLGVWLIVAAMLLSMAFGWVVLFLLQRH